MSPKYPGDLQATARKLSEAEVELNIATSSSSADIVYDEESSITSGALMPSAASASTGESAEQLAKRAMDMIRRHEQRQEEIENTI